MEFAQLEEKKVSCETIYDGHVVHLEKWNVVLPNGKGASREIVRHVGAAAVVAVDDKNRVAMVRQYRAALERVTFEIPAGKLDSFGADRFETAKRELREETGFTAREWTHLADIATTPGFCSEIIGLYLARGLEKGDTEFDEDEFLNIEMVPMENVLADVFAGKIQDAKTVCALLLAQKHMA